MKGKDFKEYCNVCDTRIDSFGIERHTLDCSKLKKYKKRKDKYELIATTLVFAILFLSLGSLVTVFFYIIFYYLIINLLLIEISLIYLCVWLFVGVIFMRKLWEETVNGRIKEED